MWLRGVAFVSLVCSVGVARAEPAPPTFAAALAQAAADGKPLVVELSATWCGPCQEFARTVLVRPEIRAAIASTHFVAYDIDSSEGDIAFRRLGFAGVPAFAILDTDGRTIERHEGGGDAAWFLDFLGHGLQSTSTLADLERAVARAPDSVAAHRKLADAYVSLERVDEAVTELHAIGGIASASRAELAAAAADVDELAGGEARIAAEVAAAVEFARRYPDAPATSDRLALVAVSHRVPAETIAELVHAHLDQIPIAALAPAVRVALMAGAVDDARLATTRATGATGQLLEAEIALATGDRARARALVASACAGATKQELACYGLTQALALRSGRPPGLDALASHANAVLAALAHPGGKDRSVFAVTDLETRDLALGNAIAASLEEARAACADRGSFASVELEFSSDTPRIRGRVDSRSAAMKTCVQDAIDRTRRTWPTTTLRAHVYGIVLGTKRTEAIQESKESKESKETFSFTAGVRSGALVYIGGLGGSATGGALGVRGIWNAAPLGELRLVLEGEAELGTSDRPTYVGRALAGIAVAGNAGAAVAILSGVGGSRYDRATPGALEVPIELLVAMPLGRLHLALSLQSVHIVGEPARVRDGGETDAFEGDELAAGIGASFPVHGVRVFGGFTAEARARETSYLVALGLPFGGFF